MYIPFDVFFSFRRLMSVPDYSMKTAPALVTRSKRYLFSVDRILCAGKTLSFTLYNIYKSALPGKAIKLGFLVINNFHY